MGRRGDVPHAGDVGSVVAEHVGSRHQGHRKRDFGTVNLSSGSGILDTLAPVWWRGRHFRPLHAPSDCASERHIDGTYGLIRNRGWRLKRGSRTWVLGPVIPESKAVGRSQKTAARLRGTPGIDWAAQGTRSDRSNGKKSSGTPEGGCRRAIEGLLRPITLYTLPSGCRGCVYLMVAGSCFG